MFHFFLSTFLVYVQNTPEDQVLYEGDKAWNVNRPFRLCYNFKGWNTAKDGCGENWDFNKTKNARA
ncbi:InlB B-repeat-containing protein [endosymbiont 'TC1' of Trimyema compressum]|uniref:InlB B-repeat-containing protein n=1 Tax=endosymbiont 'TC1' of Trimyema compressum TaxID=243899 RepID=UPI00139225E8|nr:InlB B-repeat-containing protein [endosymbiont 'TC1' of Trimyema compressum]